MKRNKFKVPQANPWVHCKVFEDNSGAIEIARLPIITNGLMRLCFPWTEPPIITGSSGRVQGASAVKIPALNAIIANDIVIIGSLKVHSREYFHHSIF